MITKTLSGIPMLDEPHGGIFSNRSFLVTGAKNSGKTVLGLQFTRQGLEQNERCLYLSTMVADDLGILAESLGFDLTPHLASEALTLLEYESFMSGGGAPGLDMLPPEGFEQLKNIIHANSIERVVLDTVLPWVSVRQPERMPEQVFSFTRSFDRLGVTTMLTLPKPVSSLAYRLKKSIEDVVPISILLQPPLESKLSQLQVVKYLGEKKLEGKRPFIIQDGVGMRECTPEEVAEAQKQDEISSVSTESSESSDADRSEPAESQDRPSVRVHSTRRPRFSTITFDHTRDSTSGDTSGHSESNVPSSDKESESSQPNQAPPQAGVQSPPPEVSEESLTKSSEDQTPGSPAPIGAVKLSSVWRPQSAESNPIPSLRN